MVSVGVVGVVLVALGALGWKQGWFSGQAQPSGSELNPPSAEDFEDGVQPIALEDTTLPPPAFTPEDATRSATATFSVDLGDRNEDPNDGRPVVVEYEGHQIVFAGGVVTMFSGNGAAELPDDNEMLLVAYAPNQPANAAGKARAWPGWADPWRYGVRVAELGVDGAVKIYDTGANAADWAVEQLGQAADATWDGAKLVFNETVDAAQFVGKQVVIGGEWVWDGTKYVLVKTGNAGVFVWDESVAGGRWVFKKGEAAAEWIALHYDLEKVCGPKGSPGPGSGSSGTGAPAYPAPGYSAPEGKQDFLDLARAWMPYLRLSNDEKCGEILRVVAKVFPYHDNTVIDNLADADRVEIVYTLFFAYDGGRWYGGAHAGDNEGFVIGLLPTDETTGRCGATSEHFQFYGGRTVKHKDVDLTPDMTLEEFSRMSGLALAKWGLGTVAGALANDVVRWAGFEKGIEDFDWHAMGTSCPGGDDTGYALWVAESKHATYFSQAECEGTMLSWEVMGIPLGGLEECEGGRSPSDLRNRVELWDASMNTQASPLHDKSYGEASRGNGGNPSDLYHVPMLECPDFDSASAIPIRLTGIPDDSAWTVTVLGMGDFDPMVGVSGNPFICNDDSDAASAYSVSGIPGYGSYSGSRRSAQISLTVIEGGERVFYVDSRDGNPSAFVAILESSDGGLGISPAGDTDGIYAWGIAGGDLGVYALAEGGVNLTLANPATGISSDDESAMAGMILTAGGRTYSGTSQNPYIDLDLGGSAGEREFVVGSAGGTVGRYALVIVTGSTPLEETAAPSRPVITSVTGPSSVPADGDTRSFEVSFTDDDGDVSRLVVNSEQGGWNPLDFDPKAYLVSGTASRGTTAFEYSCRKGSLGFSDTLRITLYDAAGNASDTYRHALSCESVATPTPTPTQPRITPTYTPTSTRTRSTPTPTPTRTATVTPAQATAYLNFSADSTSLSSGQCTNLRWDSRNITAVYLDGQGVTGSETRQVCPTTTTTYTLTASSSQGTLTRSVTITVAGAAIVFPPQRTSKWVALTFPGGHGSTHRIDEGVQLCYTVYGTRADGPAITYTLYDYQPAREGSNGVDTSGPRQVHTQGQTSSDITDCINGQLTGPEGFEAFRLEVPLGDGSIQFAELWIYVQR